MSRAQQSDPTRVASAGKTDVGRRRKHNEDSILLRPELNLYVVADGMGGHNAGEVASALAARSVENYVAATPAAQEAKDLSAAGRKLTADAGRLVGAVKKANADVYEIASTRRQHAGMGSTMVAALVSEADGQIHICHVGDSRCYRVRDEAIQQLTRDHSLINDAIAMRPDLTPEILAELPKNVITRAVGTQETLEVDIRSEVLRPGDLYLMCSDGLSGLVNEEQINDACTISTDLEELCDLLIIMANEAGGTDNISVLAVRVESVSAAACAQAERLLREAEEAQAGAEEGVGTTTRPGKQLEAALAVLAGESDAESKPLEPAKPAASEDEAGEVVVAVAGDEAAAEKPGPLPTQGDGPFKAPSGPPVETIRLVAVGMPAPSDRAADRAFASEPVVPKAAEGQPRCASCKTAWQEDAMFCVTCGKPWTAPSESQAAEAESELGAEDEAELAALLAAGDAEVVEVAAADEPPPEPPVAGAGRPCRACGASVPASDRFCGECGARQD